MANIVLSDGKEVNISSVLFNKEQNINVSKTYITTVKKAVTKVSEDFYKINNKKEVLAADLKIDDVPVMPEVEINQAKEVSVVRTSEDEQPTNEEIMNSFVESPKEAPVVEPVLETPMEDPTVLSIETPVEVPEVKVETPVINPEPNSDAPTLVVKEDGKPKAEEVLPVQNAVSVIEKVEAASIIPTASAVPATPAVEETKVTEPILPVTEPTEVTPSVSEEPELIFDASKETNLNFALGEVTSDTSVKVEDASPLREFGKNESGLNETPDTPILEEAPKAKTLTRSKGFANSKFVTVIAVVFFIAACVFLGYELFNYFQLTK